jgi:hypothetical protein
MLGIYFYTQKYSLLKMGYKLYGVTPEEIEIVEVR